MCRGHVGAGASSRRRSMRRRIAANSGRGIATSAMAAMSRQRPIQKDGGVPPAMKGFPLRQTPMREGRCLLRRKNWSNSHSKWYKFRGRVNHRQQHVIACQLLSLRGRGRTCGRTGRERCRIARKNRAILIDTLVLSIRWLRVRAPSPSLKKLVSVKGNPWISKGLLHFRTCACSYF